MSARKSSLDNHPNPRVVLVKILMEQAGYRWEVSADGLEEKVIRPDGTVAIIARKG